MDDEDRAQRATIHPNQRLPRDLGRRGGHNQNNEFVDMVLGHRDYLCDVYDYTSLNNAGKRGVQLMLYDYIRSNGGRILKMYEPTGMFYVMSQAEALEVMAAKLRDGARRVIPPIMVPLVQNIHETNNVLAQPIAEVVRNEGYTNVTVGADPTVGATHQQPPFHQGENRSTAVHVNVDGYSLTTTNVASPNLPLGIDVTTNDTTEVLESTVIASSQGGCSMVQLEMNYCDNSDTIPDVRIDENDEVIIVPQQNEDVAVAVVVYDILLLDSFEIFGHEIWYK